MAWIRMNPELVHGSGSGTWKMKSWIRIRIQIRNKAYGIWIHYKAFYVVLGTLLENIPGSGGKQRTNLKLMRYDVCIYI